MNRYPFAVVLTFILLAVIFLSPVLPWDSNMAQEQWKQEVSGQIQRTTFIVSFLLITGAAAIIFILVTILRRNISVGTAATRQEGDRAAQLSRQHGREVNEKVNQFGSDIKEILTGQMERILKMMEEQSRASAQETIKLEVTRPDGVSEIRTDINPHIRARANGVELIEETIDDPETGEKLVEPFLADVDSRVRANAGRAMYKYNREKGMVALNEMCRSADQWMRLSGAWAMGEIGNDIAIKSLVNLLDDPKDFVVGRTIKSLEKALENRGNEFEEELVQKIERKVKDARIQRKIKDK